jgi:RNA polymerase sigma-70 factor (ECF subfamily)
LIDQAAFSYKDWQMPRSLRRAQALADAALRQPPSADLLLSWVAQTRLGDPGAARSLLEAVTPAVRTVVQRALGRNHPDASDLLQDSLLGFVRALDLFRGECSVVHYARRIALWRVLEEQKRRQTQKRAPESLAHDDPERAQSPAPVDPDALDARARALLRELMYTLRPEQAEALALRHVLDYSVDEIAEATGTLANTVRSRLRLAKQALRARIETDPRFAALDGGRS